MNEWEKWSDDRVAMLQTDFLAWYHAHRRNLPWRYDQEPYRIWISEIMLQQTRVETVIDYYYRFMEALPDLKALAEVPEERLLKLWEGLGYYSRARNLQAAAKTIMTEYDGRFPETIETIRSLKGIGPYTAGAIGSIAFGLPEPAIDGNVMRVVSRLFCIDADIAKPASRKIFDAAMRRIIDQKQPGDFNQALMDLGSAICTPSAPNCAICPLADFCQANALGRQTDFPVKSKKQPPKPVYYIAEIIENEAGAVLLSQRQNSGLLAGMWHFPLRELTEQEYQKMRTPDRDLFSFLAAEESTDLQKELYLGKKRLIGEITHIFSHLKWHVLVIACGIDEKRPLAKNQRWVAEADFSDYVFPKPQQKILAVWEKYKNQGNH